MFKYKQEEKVLIKRLEDVEKLKFQQDKSCGLTYFDVVNRELETRKDELE